MSKTWYYRLLFSYMPVFFLMISFLFFIFFQVLTERAQKDTEHIYASVNNQIVQTVEQPLQSIDHMMVTIQTRSKSDEFNMLDYFDQEGQPSVFFTYQMTKEFNNMKQLYQSIHSIYLVRERDGFVLSSNTVSPLEQFSDKAFVDQLRQDNYSYHWTNVRPFKEFHASREEPVVSLARKYLTSRGESGLIIINVRASSLEGLVSQKMDQTASYVTIMGKDNEPVFNPVKENSERRKAISTIVSDYTGWTYESGLEKGSSFTLLQTFSSVWIILALVVAVIGMLSIVYMTNRNYKPLRALISKLDKISHASGEQSAAERNEFHYIESTVDSLVQRFNLFKSQSDLNSGYRKKSIFVEVMNGSRSLANAEWNAEMERHGFTGGFRKSSVIVISIDKYSDVLSRYREQDMILFRFIIQNMYMELIQRYGLSSWSEWVNDKEMCGFIYVQEADENQLMDSILKVSDNALQWIRANLPFTATFGIGQTTDSVAMVKSSYKNAIEAVNFRLVFGNNRTIGYWETETGTSFELYNQLEQIRNLIYAFRLMEPEWRLKYGTLFEQFKQNKLKREDMVNLLNYFVFYLFEHVHGTILNDEIMETNKAIMKDVIDQFETLEDVQEEILGIMEKLEYVISEKASRGGAAEIALKMKLYIEEHVFNPDLSLIHLSQQFDIPSKNVSSLFKEQFNIKFIDFLIHRRVELAKQLLLEKEMSVQEIGRTVGYLNPVSFNRVFKRVVGVPPGDYRKEKSG
ncbi:helix-turn-helix domain-containing protein [Paenibacillus sp. FJAT-27812]|uniref:helix-turn-helix domain-containing protein n=1 Tax=Paenibacillus sp. FJAT-27812 TaxID=1684143 RepID=UPI0006A7729C|nr:helix-turn-helix domain-containing protein [Paenibacillus sp. FJAT-27812]